MQRVGTGNNTKAVATAPPSAQHGQHLLQQRWERKLTSDHFGNNAWASMRRDQLSQIPGGQVAAQQYGLSFARDLPVAVGDAPLDPLAMAPKPHFSRLDINHFNNSAYQRAIQTQQTGTHCHALHQKKFPEDKVTFRSFVNSPYMAKKLDTHLSVHIGKAGAVDTRVLADGIVALSCHEQKDFDAIEDLLNLMGGRVSPYQALRAHLEASGNSQPHRQIPGINNTALLDAVGKAGDGGCLAQLRQVPADLGTATMANTAADLLEQFIGAMRGERGIGQAHQHDPVLANAIQHIKFIADSLPSQANDSARFGNAYRALLEEMQVVLATVRPYDLADFKQAACARVARALPAKQRARMVAPEAFLTTCGMQALTQSLNLARSVGKGRLEPLTNGKKESPLYYEAEKYLSALRPAAGGATPQQAAFHATLSDSFPHAPSQKRAGWTLQDVVGGIRKQLSARGKQAEPLTVVIDSTIEHGGDMDALLKALGQDLAGDRLRIVLCRSHLKYANLGSSKVMGGSVILLGADTAKNRQLQQNLRNDEAGQDWFSNDESQLLTHLTKVGQQRELEMLQTAIDNTGFIVEHCFHGKDGHAPVAGFDPNKPFAVFNTFGSRPPNEWPGYTYSKDGAAVAIPIKPTDMLNRDVIRDRYSFGFTEAVIGMLGQPAGYDDTMLRVAMGQETRPELMERFWMPSRQMQPNLALLTNQAALEHATALADEAMVGVPGQEGAKLPLSQKLQAIARHEAAADTPEFTLNKIASVACHLAHLTQKFDLGQALAQSDDRRPLDELLHGLIDSGMPGVSPLAKELIIGLQCTLLSADMRHGEAPVRRAAVNQLLHTLEHSGFNPTLGLFDHVIPDQAYLDLPPRERGRLIHRLFTPLETPTKMQFLVEHKAKEADTAFLKDCAYLLQIELKKPAPSAAHGQWHQRLLKELEVRQLTSA